MTCVATTQAGRRCARPPLRGSELCHAHRGVAVGRPSKLTDELEAKLCDALRAGNHLEVAACYAGVSRSTVHRWLSLAQADGAEERLVEFREAVRKAEANAEVHAVGVLRKAIAHGEWRAALAYLERRYPQRWRTRHDQYGTGPGQHAQPTADLDTNDPKARALLSELLRHRQTAR
jgi:hypothetical protein